jgi:hypothetical protein
VVAVAETKTYKVQAAVLGVVAVAVLVAHNQYLVDLELRDKGMLEVLEYLAHLDTHLEAEVEQPLLVEMLHRDLLVLVDLVQM